MEARDVEALTARLREQNASLRRGEAPEPLGVTALTDALEQGLAHHRGMLPAALQRSVRALSRAARENKVLLDAAHAGTRAAAAPLAYGADGGAIGANDLGAHDRKV